MTINKKWSDAPDGYREHQFKNAYEYALKQEEKEEEKLPSDKKCRYCFSVIPYRATRCPHCTSELPKPKLEQ